MSRSQTRSRWMPRCSRISRWRSIARQRGEGEEVWMRVPSCPTSTLRDLDQGLTSRKVEVQARRGFSHHLTQSSPKTTCTQVVTKEKDLVIEVDRGDQARETSTEISWARQRKNTLEADSRWITTITLAWTMWPRVPTSMPDRPGTEARAEVADLTLSSTSLTQGLFTTSSAL